MDADLLAVVCPAVGIVAGAGMYIRRCRVPDEDILHVLSARSRAELVVLVVATAVAWSALVVWGLLDPERVFAPGALVLSVGLPVLFPVLAAEMLIAVRQNSGRHP